MPSYLPALLCAACALWAPLALASTPAAPKPLVKLVPDALPAQDLRLELRQADLQQGNGMASTEDSSTPMMPPQMLRVRNGEPASLQLGQSVPLQWVEAVSMQGANLSAGGASANSQGAAVHHTTTWVQTGQHIALLPRWTGGQHPVVVEVRMQTARLAERHTEALPARHHQTVLTTVSAPLGEWITLATSGAPPTRGVYQSQPDTASRRILQLRVSLP